MVRYLLVLVVFLTLSMSRVLFAQVESTKGESQPLMSLAIQWDRATQAIMYDGSSVPIGHVYLLNPLPKLIDPALIKRVYLAGKDAAEFSIVNTEAPSLSNFILPSGDSDWFDILFTPDLTKPTNAVREAQLVSVCDASTSDSVDIIYFTGIVQTQGLRNVQMLEGISISPNPLTVNIVNVSFALREEKKLSFAVYDMLGREVTVLREKIYSAGKNSLPIAIGDVAAGVYILRVSDDASTKCISIRVVK